MVMLVALLQAGLVASCSSQGANEEPANALRVLFVGNSYTYTHDIPSIVAALADAAEARPLVYQTVAFPGVSLEEHWHDGTALDALDDKAWDYVVLQQGPSTLASSREHLVFWTERFAAEIRNAGAEPALYMVWPEQARQSALPQSIASYTEAAEAVDGLLLPVGAAWQEAWSRDATLPLYSSDALHPSLTGAYFAALVIYGGLYQQSPKGLPGRLETESGVSINLSSSRGALLRAVADEVLFE